MYCTFSFSLQWTLPYLKIFRTVLREGCLIFSSFAYFRYKELLHVSLIRVYQSFLYIFCKWSFAHLFEGRTDKLGPSAGRQQPPLLWALCDWSFADHEQDKGSERHKRAPGILASPESAKLYPVETSQVSQTGHCSCRRKRNDSKWRHVQRNLIKKVALQNACLMGQK